MEQLSEKVYSWASILDDQSRQQVLRTGRLPIVDPHVAVMPDAHWGRGATVGSVIATQGGIIPAAVGVDIGCGLQVMRLDLGRKDLGSLPALRQRIERDIPRGTGQNRRETDTARGQVTALERQLPNWLDPDAFAKQWRHQIGTLGGGNHFLEVAVDEEGLVWLLLHSGSRHIGLQLATRFIDIARAQRQVLEDRDLAWLPEGTTEFRQYTDALAWVQAYARRNRDEMMRRMHAAVKQQIGTKPEVLLHFDVHHNYAQRETHFGKDVWVTRKGAIRAGAGELGVIPGSMGTPSYIVTGKGNPQAFASAPHGAGRAMSRGQAKRELDLAQFKAQMAGIETAIHAGLLDEAPLAYKDIRQIMADAADLVEVTHTLRPILNIKG